MDYLPVEACLQALCRHAMPLSPAQSKRIAEVSVALLLAGEVNMSKIARFAKGAPQQDSRIRWIERLLQAPFMSQESVYQPMLDLALATFQERYWHLVIDRTTLWRGEIDLATIALNYRKRAIPFVWTQVPFGGALKPLILPSSSAVTCSYRRAYKWCFMETPNLAAPP